MIPVDMMELRLPDGWLARAASATADIERYGDEAQRRRAIDTHAAIWRDLKVHLADISHQKCWYCETRVVRDDWSVDHYRPKAGVIEDVAHPGYWWLAFDRTNFRLSCQFCNERRVDRDGETEGGKACHFPLLPGGIRATPASRNLVPERPVLLDPTRVMDPPLLNFLVDGRVIERHSAEDNWEHFERANKSIRILHLDNGRLVIERSRVCMQAGQAVERADAAYRELIAAETGGHGLDPIDRARRAFEGAVEIVWRMSRPYSVYAAAVRDVLNSEPPDQRPWLRVVLP